MDARMGLRMSRSGSEKRQRCMTLSARFNQREADAIREAADRAGVSVAALIRHAVLAAPLPRGTRRPTVNHEVAARLLGEIGKLAGSLRAAAQTAKVPPDDPHLSAALRDLAEMRSVCFQAMGREP